ncbi:MAG: DUF3800 domain-containing protein [Chloroflexi bacterium]|nr:DUF3800 domain-containing protein [Chloroflexota bacterium]
MSNKRYYYVDETGQDTKGQLFIVAVVVAGQYLEDWRKACEEIEKQSRRGRRKWMRTTPDRRLVYIRLALQKPLFAGRLTFARHADSRDYDSLTTQTIALAVKQTGNESHNVIVVDALPKEQWQDYSRRIRRWGAKVEKVRGVRREENDALIRLADAVCGFVREAHEGRAEMKALFDAALEQGIIRDLGR